MILEFKVRNFFSIREEQVLSFEATADTTLEDIYVVKKGKYRILKSAILFGPNASGKTNIISALQYLRKFAFHQAQNKVEGTAHIPFLLDEDSRNKNGYMELSFFVDDKLYVYSLELNHQYVQNEKLIHYPGVKSALVFNRHYNPEKEITEIDFGSSFKIKSTEKSMLQTGTLINMSVLAAFSKLNIDFPVLEEVSRFFKNHLVPLISSGSSLRSWTNTRVKDSNEVKSFVLKMLQNADNSIKNIRIDKFKDFITPEFVKQVEQSGLPDDQKALLLSEEKVTGNVLSFIRGIKNSEAMVFPTDFESAGTNRLYDLSGVLFDAITMSRCLLVDELDNSLHPDMVNHFYNTFLVNAHESQLIFTTHNINILSEQDNLRKDIIWFTQKSKEGETELYSMADFNHRKELSFINAYKAGKFGAKPKPGSIFMNS
jgi:uncharacterized protein